MLRATAELRFPNKLRTEFGHQDPRTKEDKTEPYSMGAVTVPNIEEKLRETRLAFLDWSVQPNVSPESFEVARTAITAAVWGQAEIPTFEDGAIPLSDMPTAARHPPPRYEVSRQAPALWIATVTTAAARHAGYQKGKDQSGNLRRATVTTARTLQREERLLSSAETTRQTILESYVNVGTPNMKELLSAQGADPNCTAIRSYLATGHATAITGSRSLYHSRWIQREAAFIRIMDGGLLYRLDPQRPKGPKDKRPGVPQRFSAPRLYIPDELRAAYLHAFHERFGHPGEHRMFNVLRERYYWPGLHADVVKHVRECHECTLAKRLT
jgi:hypothetical protein